jgi:hypothetical protein
LRQVKGKAAEGGSVGGMNFIESVAILGGTFLVVLVIGAVVMAEWRGLPSGPLPLYEMLVRQSPRAASMALASGSRDFALAVRQCVTCDARNPCRVWLASGKRDGFDGFCANSGYVTRMRLLAE